MNILENFNLISVSVINININDNYDIKKILQSIWYNYRLVDKTITNDEFKSSFSFFQQNPEYFVFKEEKLYPIFEEVICNSNEKKLILYGTKKDNDKDIILQIEDVFNISIIELKDNLFSIENGKKIFAVEKELEFHYDQNELILFCMIPKSK